MIKVVEALELSFFDLEHIEDPLIGEGLLKEYLQKHPQYKGGYTIEYYLERYRNGRIFVVVSRPRKPILKYDYKKNEWILLNTHISSPLDFSIRSIAQSLRPPARIEPKSPKTKEEAEKEAQALQDKGFTSMVSVKDPSGDGYIVCNRETAGQIASKGSTAEMTYISGVNGPKAEAVVDTVETASIVLGGLGAVKATVKHGPELMDGAKKAYKAVKKSLKKNANRQIDKLNKHPDLEPKLRDDGTTEYIDKSNQKVIAEVDKDGVLSYKYDGFGGDIVMDPDKTTTIIGKFDDPTKEGTGVKHFLGDEDTGVVGYPKGTISKGHGKKGDQGGVNVLSVSKEDSAKVAEELGENGFWERYNKPFLEEAFKRGDNIRLVSNPSKKSGTRTGYYKRELESIEGENGLAKQYGYVYDKTTNTYIKTKKGTKG